MTYSDWREDLSEGAKTRLVIKGLKAIKSAIKKGGEKITRDIGSIGGTKASGRLNLVQRVDPELIKQFPGVNIRKLAYPDYKANRNPKLAKAIRIAKEKLEREKLRGMGGSPGQLYKGVDLNKQVKKSKKDTYINPADGKEYDIPEEAMAVPTNNASGDAIAGLPPDNPPVKRKKKTYAYGGRGSRKMWMNNK